MSITLDPLKELDVLFENSSEFWHEGRLDTLSLIEAIKQNKIVVIKN